VNRWEDTVKKKLPKGVESNDVVLKAGSIVFTPEVMKRIRKEDPKLYKKLEATCIKIKEPMVLVDKEWADEALAAEIEMLKDKPIH
jgi:hypothetical protein